MTFVVTSCFFFQAEDGIRDLTVTGVQTCAFRTLVSASAAPESAKAAVAAAIMRMVAFPFLEPKAPHGSTGTATTSSRAAPGRWRGATRRAAPRRAVGALPSVRRLHGPTETRLRSLRRRPCRRAGSGPVPCDNVLARYYTHALLHGRLITRSCHEDPTQPHPTPGGTRR